MAIIQGTSKSSAAAAYEISQSVRFNDDDAAYLEWSGYSGSPTSGTDCTFSFWLKRCKLGATQVCIYGGDANGATYEGIRFDSDDQFRVFQASSAYDIITSQVFRDVSAWSHFVVAFDTDNSTAADRIKIYHNGSRITDFSLETNPSSGYVTNFNTGGAGEAIQIGREGGNSQFFDGYLSEINFVDGQALDPTSFGETNADTGQWVPVKYTGSYGVNGYYLKGQDSSNLGDDSSGNGNNFTSSGLTAADQMPDTPTNNFCTWNPTEPSSKTNMSLQDGNLVANGFDSAQRGTIFVSSGKWYAELTISAAMSAYFGISEDTANMTGNPSLDNLDGYLYYSFNGQKIDQAGSGSAYGDTWRAAGKTVGVAVDMDNGAIWFSVDGVWQNSATISEIQNGTTTNAAFTGISGNFALVYSNFTAGLGTLNTGQSSFSYTQPTGFNAWSTAGMEDPSIADPSAYFQTSLWNGNGSTQTITQDGNSTFQPGLIWSKGRNNAQEHVVFDEVRGTTKYLKVSPAGTEATQSGVTAFNSDGFDLGSWAGTNGSGQTHVGWQWKAGGTSGSSNTDGSITSTVSADTTSGFSISTYTGNATVGATVGHGLGVAPKMVIVKSRSNAENWIVGHDSMGWTKAAYLNSTSTPFTLDIYWNNTAPTSSVVELHDHVTTNGSGYTYVMYSFAEIPGYSRISSFVGNGSNDGPMVYTGFRPAQIVIKEITTADSWEMYDSARDPINVTGRTVRADSANAEFDGRSLYRSVDFLSNGFKIRTSNATINSSGATFIFWAFAESPFKTATAR